MAEPRETAMQVARDAKAGLRAHEDLCAERYKNIHGRLDDLLAGVKDNRAASDAHRERQSAEATKDRNWLRAILVAVAGWLAVQLWEGVSDRLDQATAPRPAAVATR